MDAEIQEFSDLLKRAEKSKNDTVAKKMNEWKEQELNPQMEETKEQIDRINDLNEFDRVSQAFQIVKKVEKIKTKQVCQFKILEDPKEADFSKGEFVFENYLERLVQ